MGLDTSHDCWHGSYSSFTRWRDALWEAAGHRFEPTPGPDIFAGRPRPALAWDQFEAKNFMGEWDSIPEDPLILLIAHSDCEGEIKHEHTSILADRLEELLPNLPDGPIRSHRGDAQEFIDGLRLADSRGENVDFH